MSDTVEFRCTRNAMYDAPGCPGHNNFCARQGHYFHTETVMGAVIGMISSFPKEIAYGFTIQDVKSEAVYTWDVTTGLIEYKPDGESFRQVHRSGYSAFNLPWRILRGKDMEQEPLIAKSLDDLDRAVSAAIRKTQEEQHREDERQRSQRRQAALDAEADERGDVRMEGWVIAHLEPHSMRKKVQFRVPKETYEQWVKLPDNIDAYHKIQSIMEDVSEVYRSDDLEGWEHIDPISVEDVSFKLEGKCNASDS